MGASLLERAARAVGPEKLAAEFAPDEWQSLLYTWEALARPEQLPPPGDWRTWLIKAGRGWGKSRSGAEFIRQRVEEGRSRWVYIVGATASDIRDVMIEGESGIMAVSPPWSKPVYEPSKMRLTWPNGAVGLIRSADEPDRMRGPQANLAWADELAAWRYGQEAWDQLQFGLRLPGGHVQICVTTTPRPTPLIREIIADPATVVTGGSSYENAANVDARWLARIRTKYEGTRLGRQEIGAEVLDDNPAALWKATLIEAARVRAAPELCRVAIGVDPAVSNNAKSDETGIVVAGVGECRCKGAVELHAFILDDVSDTGSPKKWAEAVAKVYQARRADRVVAEVNNGGDLVEANLQANAGMPLPYRAVHASRGKQTRAEPIAGLAEQGKIHHVGTFPKLEDQLTQWNPLTDKSPDRLDAYVYVLTELMLGAAPASYRSPSTRGGRRM